MLPKYAIMAALSVQWERGGYKTSTFNLDFKREILFLRSLLAATPPARTIDSLPVSSNALVIFFIKEIHISTNALKLHMSDMDVDLN